MISKREALYVAHPMGGRRCYDCTMFLSGDRCTLVSGMILPDGHCQYWEPKKAVKSFADLVKSEPSVSSVHVSTALGNQAPYRRRRYVPFLAFVSGGPKKPQDGPSTFGPTPVLTATDKRYGRVADLPATVRGKLKGKKARQWMHVWNSSYDRHGDEARAFAEAWSTVKKADSLSTAPLVGLKNRALYPFDAGTYHVPFPTRPAALGMLRPDQVPRFLDAVTHPKRLPTTAVDLRALTAIKDRVTDEATTKHLRRLSDGERPKPAVVVRLAGSDHIADGHDRLAAGWLNGDDHAVVRYLDLDPFSEEKPDPSVQHEGSRYDLLQPANGRRLNWNANGTLASPFTYDPAFLAGLRPDQVPKFLWAITHQKKVDKATVPLASLRAIQDRVNPDTVAAHIESDTKKRPIIVRVNGANYIGDGHDRLAARWLSGADDAKVRLYDVGSYPSNSVYRAKAWSTPFKIEKADADKQQLFGWASVVTKNGQAIIDKQGDVIPVDELENAAYDFVLSSRKQGDMHARTDGVGRLIESMVFSAEKQKALGIDLGIEGWWVGFQCDCRELWKDVKSGKKLEFSIGGAAISEKIADG